jgi:hypothetical protein
VIDNAELWACGVTRDSVMRWRRNGTLYEVFPGVYTFGRADLSLRGRFLAATKAAGPGAALSHRSAGVSWDLLTWDESWLPEVTIPMRGAREMPGVIIHRTRVPFEIVRLDGIPLTIPARTAVDLATVLPYRAVRRAVREGMARKRITVKDLVAIRGRKGATTVRRILADGHVPTRSEFEDAVLDLLDRGGFPRPDVNTPIMVAGRRIVPDFRWPEKRLVIEADGRQWHDNDLAREDDAERQARLEAAGERVIRVTWEQVLLRPDQTIARIRAAW